MENLQDYISNPFQLGRHEADSLELLCEKYPYFQALHILLAKCHKNQNTFGFNKNLKLASLYAGDRKVLFNYINAEENLPFEEEIVEQPEEIIEETVEPIDEQTTAIKDISETLEKIEPIGDSLDILSKIKPPEKISSEADKVYPFAWEDEIAEQKPEKKPIFEVVKKQEVLPEKEIVEHEPEKISNEIQELAEEEITEPLETSVPEEILSVEIIPFENKEIYKAEEVTEIPISETLEEPVKTEEIYEADSLLEESFEEPVETVETATEVEVLNEDTKEETLKEQVEEIETEEPLEILNEDTPDETLEIEETVEVLNEDIKETVPKPTEITEEIEEEKSEEVEIEDLLNENISDKTVPEPLEIKEEIEEEQAVEDKIEEAAEIESEPIDEAVAGIETPEPEEKIEEPVLEEPIAEKIEISESLEEIEIQDIVKNETEPEADEQDFFKWLDNFALTETKKLTEDEPKSEIVLDTQEELIEETEVTESEESNPKNEVSEIEAETTDVHLPLNFDEENEEQEDEYDPAAWAEIAYEIQAFVKTPDVPEEKEFTPKKVSKVEIDDLLDKFIKKNPSISRPKAEFYKPENMARKSEEFHAEVVSETLAQLFYKQGHLHKSLEIYEKLMLQNPDKKDIFAARIKTIKEELINRL